MILKIEQKYIISNKKNQFLDYKKLKFLYLFIDITL